MGLVTILALLAFGISLVALWLTSDVIKKVESQNEKFVRAHMGAVREELRDLEKLIEKTSRMVAKDHEGQAVLGKDLSEQTKALDELRQRIAMMDERVEDLDQSIPPRYRVRVVKPNPKDARKPSIQ